MNPVETSLLLQPYIRQLFADYPGGLVCVSHDRRFLKEVCQRIYRLTESGLEELNKYKRKLAHMPNFLLLFIHKE